MVAPIIEGIEKSLSIVGLPMLACRKPTRLMVLDDSAFCTRGNGDRCWTVRKTKESTSEVELLWAQTTI
jgi:hypothetical protein